MLTLRTSKLYPKSKGPQTRAPKEKEKKRERERERERPARRSILYNSGRFLGLGTTISEGG